MAPHPKRPRDQTPPFSHGSRPRPENLSIRSSPGGPQVRGPASTPIRGRESAAAARAGGGRGGGGRKDATPFPGPSTGLAPLRHSHSSLGSTSLVGRLIADSARRKAKAGKPASPPSLPLSSILSKSLPQVFDGKRLSVVGRGVTALDHIPDRIGLAVTSLFLSDNNLTSLQGLRQFPNLRSLSLANNLIRRLVDLEPLRVSRDCREAHLPGVHHEGPRGLGRH